VSTATILLTVAFVWAVCLGLWGADSYARNIVRRLRAEREEYERRSAADDQARAEALEDYFSEAPNGPKSRIARDPRARRNWQ
jgi:hypothetical protein